VSTDYKILFLFAISATVAACGDSTGDGGGGGGGGGESCPFEVHNETPKIECPCNTFGTDQNYVCTKDCTDSTVECPEGTGCAEGIGSSICLAPCGSGCPEGFHCAQEGEAWAGFCDPD
jgi:hypothetical protein